MSEQGEEIVRRVRRVTFWGMAVNIGLAVVKGVGGVLWSSQALLADAIHSASDLATDLAVVFGVKYWAAPADEEHPYGHGKIEALVTVFISLALLFVAYELACDTLASLRAGATDAPPGTAALVVAIVSIAAKESLFRWTRLVARTVKSPAVEANAWHHRSDALSSVPVAVAVAVERVFPSVWWADEAGALVVVAFIVHVAWEIARPAWQELTDAEMDDKAEAVAGIARKVPGVLDVHAVRARRYGGAFHADLHVQADAALSLADAHAIGHDVKEAVVSAGIDVTDVVIHVEPLDTRVIVAFGSNVEPRAEYIERARAAIEKFPCTHFVRMSSVIETDPVDVPPAYADIKFLNAVAVYETALSPEAFSRRIHAVEDALGRVRTVKNGPRTVDIDIVDFGGIRRNTPELILPHPRARERDFVMRPLRELGIDF